MDEPTTGLHPADIDRLLGIVDRLIAGGNTVVVIEHNIDVIAELSRSNHRRHPLGDVVPPDVRRLVQRLNGPFH